MRGDKPALLFDRAFAAEIHSKHPEILRAFKAAEIGVVDEQSLIKFCGLVQPETGPAYVFLPRNSTRTVRTAQLTMQALARFGREHLTREFEGRGLIGNSSLLSAIAELAEDFLHNGIFSERQRVRSRNFGKVDWARTIARVDPIYDPQTGPVYSEFLTVRGVASHETILAKVQFSVLKEIFSSHSWWLPNPAKRFRETIPLDAPQPDRMSWVPRLRNAMAGLYSDHAIYLANLLIVYLERVSNRDSGSYVFGVQDFHTVWETMLAKTLENVETGWNQKLPRAVYRVNPNEVIDAPTRTMRTDIVVRAHGGLHIIDAKYYGGQDASSLPGWSDIAKQMLYEQSLRAVVDKSTTIGNFFAFPAEAASAGLFDKIEMRKRGGGHHLEAFPVVNIAYVPITEIIQAYVQGYRRDFWDISAIPILASSVLLQLASG